VRGDAVEKVLVFPAALLGEKPFQGVLMGEEVAPTMARLLAPANLSYRDRVAAEADPAFKQVIPYVVIHAGNEFFRYRRTSKGGEGRLHGRWSVGVGGHVNPGDDGGAAECYQAAFLRELAEEVSIDADFVSLVVGLINDDHNEVGRVHFGVVHLVTVTPGTRVRCQDPALADGHFSPLSVLTEDSVHFEPWSVYVIQAVLPRLFT
jgi:predicted NUDIX family phosphoesterase